MAKQEVNYRVLAIDPGAERLGFSVLERDEEKTIHYHASGVLGLARKGAYQQYRLKLIEFWVKEGEYLFRSYRPNLLVTETVPAQGFNNSSQAQLAQAAVTVLHTIAYQKDIPIKLLGATTIKAKIGGSKKATKVKVREGVISHLPELAIRRKQWQKSQIHDESDALAVGLTELLRN